MCKVQCSKCGYLAIRENQSRNLVEVESGMRESWVHPPATAGTSFKKYDDSKPICFSQKIDFQEKLGSSASRDRIDDLVKTPIECDSYVPWKQGFSPKEHAEMELLNEQRKWQAKRDDDDRKWRAEREEIERRESDQRSKEDRDWRAEQYKLEKNWRESQKRIFWISLVVTGVIGVLLTCAATIAGSMIEAGHWLK